MTAKLRPQTLQANQSLFLRRQEHKVGRENNLIKVRQLQPIPSANTRRLPHVGHLPGVLAVDPDLDCGVHSGARGSDSVSNG